MRLRSIRTALVALLVAVMMVPVGPVSAAPVMQRDCGVYRFGYDPGKTPVGFFATATDGCHTYEWEGNIAQGPSEVKTTRLQTIGNISPGFPGYTLPGPENGNYCLYRAAHEANGFLTNHAGVPPGTVFTVSARCL